MDDQRGRLRSRLAQLRKECERVQIALDVLDELEGAGATKSQEANGTALPPMSERARVIVAIISELGGAARMESIMRSLRAKGAQLPEDDRSAYNSVYGTLKNYPNIFKSQGEGRWVLDIT